MFEDLEPILRSTKGTLAQTPLEQLFEAISQTQRTCGLELKRHAFERTVVFERGVPMGCSSNLVQESIGRVLTEKKLLKEDDYQTLLNVCVERSLRFEVALAQSKLLDLQTLEKQIHQNLAQKILDCFRWTDASYCLVGDVEFEPGAPKMNTGQLLFTAISTALPKELVASRFPVPEEQRWAMPYRPRHRADELKLSPKDAFILDALAARPTLAELCRTIEQDPETVHRRLYALALLGLAEHSEKVPDKPPVDPTAPLPQPEGRGVWLAAGVAAGLCAAAALFALRGSPAPANNAMPPPLVKKAVRVKPAGNHFALDPLPALTAAPAGAQARPDRPRGLGLSASGIALEPPMPGPGIAGGKIDAASRLLVAGKLDAARSLYDRAVRAAPKSADAAFGAALAHYASGEDDRARKRAERALELEPDFAFAHLLLGYLDQEGARVPEAIGHYQRFVELAPGSAQAEDVRELLERIKS